MLKLPKTYDPASMEGRIYSRWMKMGYFHADEHSAKPAFSISMPPPNVTGRLHMGHALDNTLQDTLVRYKRMKGYEVLWQPGTDHAAISTEVKVTEKLRSEGIDKHELGREGFLSEAWAWKEEYEQTIISQMYKLGVSADWSRTRFTMDEGCSDAVTHVFIDLYNKGLIYKGRRIINWCPVCMTSLSDAEVIHEDQDSFFWNIRYPVAGEEGRYLTVATTRPETMFGDTAVAVHPDDARYTDLIGKSVILPLIDKEIPVIADEHADMEFGTGCVKITPAHDPNDYEVGLRHSLEMPCIMTDDAHIDLPGTRYHGMDRYEAREAVVEDLRALGLLESVTPHTHAVGTHDRCHATVEPMIKPQWFVKMDKFAEHCRRVIETGELSFVPDNYLRTYMNWVNNLKDWCISRQIWWGHRIPAWYCLSCGSIHVGTKPPAECACSSTSFIQDEDTLDTWFSSALWPFSTLGWPEETDTYKKFYPNDVLVTGYDIIFFWVIRMVFSGVEQTGRCPFDRVLIHGLVRDELGRKMSKSLGNGIDPLEIVEQYGADALRAALLTGNAPGNDMRFSEKKILNARNFANKVWNASRYILMNLPDDAETADCEAADPSAREASEDKALSPGALKLLREDKWILSRLNKLVANVTHLMDSFELGVALDNTTDFLWNELCDWYIEMTKSRLYGSDAESKKAALWTLRTVLSEGLKLLHPFMPFITEEIFLSLTDEESIMISAYPEVTDERDFPEEERQIEALKDVIRAARSIRADKDVPQARKVPVYIITEDEELLRAFRESAQGMEALCRASEFIIESAKPSSSEGLVTAVTKDAFVLMPLSEMLDKVAETERLEKERERLNAELSRSRGLLSNEGFISKAPYEKVAMEQEKLKNYEEMLSRVESELNLL